MNKTLLKNAGIYVGIVLLFLVLAYAFVPEVLSGKIVNQSDIAGFKAMSRESQVWDAANPDDKTAWTGSMFSGMPNTTFMPSTEGDWTQKLYDLLMFGKRPANWLFISLLGGFLLMLSMGVNKFLAIGGAITITFCSYNLQIIQVGHNTKMQAIAFLPWVLAAVIYTYKSALYPKGKISGDFADGVKGGYSGSKKKDEDSSSAESGTAASWKEWLPKTLLGATLFGFALSFQIKANHQQITYYLAIIIAVLALGLIIQLLCEKKFRQLFGKFMTASLLLLVIGIIGIATNTTKLAPLYQYTDYTMRGGSELSHPEGGEINSEGLQLDYATAWSYGWEELPNLMIPNFNGGSSSGSINPDKSAVVALFKQAGQGNANEIAKSLPFYWGPQPFTAGPMYMGAITMFLFLLGLFLYKGKEKWWILAATLIAVFLSLGNHFMWFTKLFFDYAPFYNKFRTVSMSLVVLQVTLPMLGFAVLDRILRKEYSKKEYLRASGIAFALTGGFCLLCCLIPSIAGSFTGGSDAQMQDIIVNALIEDRKYLLVRDALTSLILITTCAALLYWYMQSLSAKDPKVSAKRRNFAGAGICLLVLLNLFSVGKRYLNSDDFITPRNFDGQFSARPADLEILKDTAKSYRVVDLSSNIFNDTFTPYWHKSIGGYSPAKLQRYQDMIDRYLVTEIQSIQAAGSGAASIQDFQSRLPELPVLSALNLKYVIIGGDYPPAVNQNAYGNAWFVDGYAPAATPDEEIGLLASTDLRRTAIIGADFPEARKAVEACTAKTANFAAAGNDQSGNSLAENGAGSDEANAKADTDKIYLASYAPNELRYKYIASSDRTAVFSEVYYPHGWKAMVDGKETDLFRADWILRGAVLPAGEHELVMRFEPEVYSVGASASRASSAILILLLILAAAGMWASKRTA